MKKSNLLGLLTLALFLSFCKNDDDIPPIVVDFPTPTYETAQYALLTPGNYWIYESFNMDQYGNIIGDIKLDSNYVEKDTVINGNSYAKFVREGLGLKNSFFLRDSADYIVDEIGNRKLGLSEFGNLLQTYEDPIISVQEYMVGFRDIETKLGEFSALKKESVYMLSGGTVTSDCGHIPVEYWVKDIGLIRAEVHYVNSCQRYRNELIRYQVN